MRTEVFLHPLRPPTKTKNAQTKADDVAGQVVGGKLANGSVPAKKSASEEPEKPQFIDPLGRQFSLINSKVGGCDMCLWERLTVNSSRLFPHFWPD